MENYDTMRYETSSDLGRSSNRRRQSSRTGGERNNVIGGYSNLVRSNSYGNLRELESEARPPPYKKRDRHQTLAYGVSAGDLGRARSYSKTDLSEWRAGQVHRSRESVRLPQNICFGFGSLCCRAAHAQGYKSQLCLDLPKDDPNIPSSG